MGNLVDIGVSENGVYHKLSGTHTIFRQAHMIHGDRMNGSFFMGNLMDLQGPMDIMDYNADIMEMWWSFSTTQLELNRLASDKKSVENGSLVNV